MSSQSSRIVKVSTKWILFIVTFFIHVGVKAWEVDLSRRTKDLRKAVGPGKLHAPEKTDESWMKSVTTGLEPTQEVVILHTENGFVPETIRLKRGSSYRVHVVNVDQKEKNISFVLDAFAENHATFFGETKTFQINPKQNGIFAFLCPETSKQGRIVIYSDQSDRLPANSP